MTSSDQSGLPINGGDVPTFGCVVYVSTTDGKVRARLANMQDLVCEASTERDALGKLVPQIKQRIREHLESGGDVPWIDPPLPIESNEQKRFIPLHL